MKYVRWVVAAKGWSEPSLLIIDLKKTNELSHMRTEERRVFENDVGKVENCVGKGNGSNERRMEEEFRGRSLKKGKRKGNKWRDEGI